MRPHYKNCFETLVPDEIIQKIELLLQVDIITGKTLLFLDEIQECPQAIQSLRYFKEQKPGLHVIGAGSLLEFALNEPHFKMPVGRVQFLFLGPMSFLEYLVASNHEKLARYIQTVSLKEPLPNPIHDALLQLVREYTLTGGMPEAVKTFLTTKKMQKTQDIHRILLSTFRSDFAKYASTIKHKYLQIVFDQCPQLVGNQIKYSRIDPDYRSRDLKEAITLLEMAGILTRIFASSCSGIPLGSQKKETPFKWLFLDIGLIHTSLNLDASFVLSHNPLLIHQGGLAEQLVGQELLTCLRPTQNKELFFWHREKPNSQAEVDYVIQKNQHILPIEVKAGKTGRLKSLMIFLEEKNAPIGVKISQHPLSIDHHILSIPFYLTSQIQRLITEAL